MADVAPEGDQEAGLKGGAGLDDRQEDNQTCGAALENDLQESQRLVYSGGLRLGRTPGKAASTRRLDCRSGQSGGSQLEMWFGVGGDNQSPTTGVQDWSPEAGRQEVELVEHEH